MTIHVEVIPHKDQKYETCGDWWWNDDTLEIRVSELGNTDWEFLIAAHEEDEAMGCRKDGITVESIDSFDKAYEAARKAHRHAPCGCLPTIESEPGDDQHAPYQKWHQIVTALEKRRAAALHVDWKAYEKKVISLSQ